MEQFDWKSESVVISPVRGVAVYRADGDIVIRQQSTHPEEPDQVIAIHPQFLTPVMEEALVYAEIENNL